MALVNPSSLYTSGAVKLDSTPSLNFYNQLLLRRQAKKDALDQYYQKMMDTMGGQEYKMRPIDIEEGWQQKLNDWQSFYLNPDNRKAILNPSKHGYEAINRFNSMYNDLRADTRKSTDRLAQEKTINEHRLSGRWIPTDGDIDEASNLAKSIYDPTRFMGDKDEQTGITVQREPNVSNLSPNIPDPTPAEKNQMIHYATGQIKPTTTAGEPDKKLGMIEYTTAYTPNDVKSIATNYANTVAGNKKFLNSYERLLHDNIHYLSYNEAYHKYFQKDIESPEEMAAAEAIMQTEAATSKKPMKWTDPEEKYRFEQARQKNRLELLGKSQGFQSWLKKQPSWKDLSGNDEDTLGAMNVLNEAKSIVMNPKNIHADDEGKNVHIEFSDPTVLKQFKDLDPSSKDAPSGLDYDFSRNKLNLIYPDGGRQEVDPKTYLKLKVKQSFPNKDIGTINNMVDKYYDDHGANLYKALKELGTPSAQPQKQKSYNYNGKTYSQDQIEKGAKHYGISVEEYLKQLGIK